MRSISGFNSNALQGAFAPGEPISASALNKLAAAADGGRTMMSNDITFQANTSGACYGFPQDVVDKLGDYLEQFKVLVEGYTVGTDTTSFSIIRVVKGEVAWKPASTTEIPVIGGDCVKQTTITTWYALPDFPVIEDGSSVYIGDGGIRVPNSSVGEIGIYIFKGAVGGVDIDPFIVATPNFTPSCPVVLPFSYPTPGVTWQVIKIGSATYVTPEPTATPPVAGGWQVTQNYIGSVSIPGGAGVPVKTPIFPQLSTQVVKPTVYAPFECVVLQVNEERYLRIAQGTVSYTESNMPEIKTGYFGHTRQALVTKVQISPSGWKVANIYPGADPEPHTVSQWMEGEGGFKLVDENVPVILYAFKWDFQSGLAPFDTLPIVNTGLPTLALISQSNSTDINRIDKDSGPSIYEQTTNVQKMSGYDAASTEEPGDWGYCHTTWVNPRKAGYSSKAIATILTVPNTFDFHVETVQVGVPLECNAVQKLEFSGAAYGSVQFTLNYTEMVDGEPVAMSATTVIPFNIADVYSTGATVKSDEFALAQSLNSMPGLAGNFVVSRAAEKTYYVTFVNKFQGTPLANMTVDTEGVTAFNYDFEVKQYVSGHVDLINGNQSGMNQLMNEVDQTEADDPYNQNKDGDPAWKDIANRADILACKDFSGDYTSEGVYRMGGAADVNPSFFLPGSCSADACDHPFQVKSAGLVDEQNTYTVCSGAVNNQIPINVDDTFALYGEGYIWLKIPYDSTNKVFPMADSITVEIGATPPYSDGDYSYVWVAHVNAGVVNQLITGSLWGDRIQLGSGEYASAQYYYAKV